MRLLVIVLTFALFLNILGLVLTNLDARVDVTFWRTEYRNLPLFGLVILSVLAGIVYAGAIAVAEGAHIRLTNRRLGREVRRLENELNYYRTQPIPEPRPEPDAVPEEGAPAAEAPARNEGAREAHHPSAPVYGADEEDWASEGDEGPYTGGRAV